MSLKLKCPFCNAAVTKKKYCDGCGEDLSIYKRAVSASNAYYNRALNKAKIRDLSGAIEDLKESLKLYKYNIPARNLLGLIYYEMGEVVSALSEWVLSKNFMPEKNELADLYMEKLQSNPAKLENCNQAIKKYNSALLSVKQDGEDLAIIQLKKVISINPNYLKAIHLLSMLYIKNGEKERAHRLLVKAAKIDVTNTTTLRYLAELGYKTDGPDTSPIAFTNPDDAMASTFSSSDFYRDDKPNVMAFVNLIIGIVVGLAVAFFLIVPSVKQNAAKDYSVDSKEYSDLIAKKDSEIKSLKTDKEVLEDEVESLSAQVEKLNKDSESNVNLSETYSNYFVAVDHYVKKDLIKCMKALKNVDPSIIEDNDVKKTYNEMKKNVLTELKETAHAKYTATNYDEALDMYKQLFELEDKDTDIIYFMARSYDKEGDLQNAKKYYKHIVDKFPNDKRATEAQVKLSALE